MKAKAYIAEYVNTRSKYLCIQAGAGTLYYFIMKHPIPILNPKKMKPLTEEFDVKDY